MGPAISAISAPPLFADTSQHPDGRSLLSSNAQVNIRLPTHVKAPKRADMLKLLKKVDADGDGELDFAEFLEAAR